MTTTIELIEQINTEANYAYRATEKTGGILYQTLTKAAQRLRELDKPHCIYTLCTDDSPTPQTLESACGGAMWYLGDDGKGEYPKFCHHCGGAVKEST